MSNFIPKPSSPKLAGLGPKAQKLAALREKHAQSDASTTKTNGASSTATPRAHTSAPGKKTSFQRKAT